MRLRLGGNCKQLGLAIAMYAQDYDEVLPNEDRDYDGSGGESAGDGTWRSMVLPYVKNVQIFRCPSHAPSSPVFDGSVADYSQNASYAFNIMQMRA